MGIESPHVLNRNIGLVLVEVVEFTKLPYELSIIH